MTYTLSGLWFCAGKVLECGVYSHRFGSVGMIELQGIIKKKYIAEKS